MLVEQCNIKPRAINREGRWHFKIVSTEVDYTEKGNVFLRTVCITPDDREMVFPLYFHGEPPLLLDYIARAIGDVCLVEGEEGKFEIDTDKFVGGFFQATVGKYPGENKAYESGYYIKSAWASRRRYDVTGSSTFKRVKTSKRKSNVYEEAEG